MGFFKKLTSKLVTPLVNEGNNRAFINFMNDDGELNCNVMPCFDTRWATDFFSYFVQNQATLINYQTLDTAQGIPYLGCTEFEYNDESYSAFGFAHYAKALTVLYGYDIPGMPDQRLMDLCIEVNKHDRVHQVGLSEGVNEAIRLEVIRQFVFSPQYRRGPEEFIQGLTQMKEFAQYLCSMPASVSPDYWTQYAPIPYVYVDIESSNPMPIIVKGAKELLFPTQDDNTWRPYIKDVRLINEDSKTQVYSMIPLITDLKQVTYHPYVVNLSPTNQQGVYRLSIANKDDLSMTYRRQMYVWDEKIVLYKKYPFLYTLHATIGPIPQELEPDTKGLCNDWNTTVHFTPSRLVYHKQPNGDHNIEIIMSAQAIEQGNTRTDFDIFGTLAKTIARVYGCMGGDE